MDIVKLLRFSSQFNKLSSSKVKIKENNNPVLKSISEAKGFEEANKIAEKHWEKLGEGSARAVYKISDKLIIKVAINEKGVQQDIAEMSFDAKSDCLANVLLADSKGKWIIMPFTDNVNAETFKKVVGCTLNNFANSLFYAFNNESDDFKKPREYDNIKKLPFFQCLSKVIISENSLIGDWSKLSSYGLLNDKIVIRDFGLSKAVYDKMYAT